MAEQIAQDPAFMQMAKTIQDSMGGMMGGAVSALPERCPLCPAASAADPEAPFPPPVARRKRRAEPPPVPARTRWPR